MVNCLTQVNALKLLIAATLLSLLVGCDNNEKASDAGNKPATSQSTTQTDTSQPQSRQPGDQQIVMADGNISMTIPAELVKQPGESDLTKIFGNMQNRHILIVTMMPNLGPEKVQEQFKTIIDTLKAQDPNLKVTEQQTINAGELKMQQISMQYSNKNQQEYAYIAIGDFGDNLINLWFTLPLADQAESQKLIDNILASIKVKN